MLQSYYMPLAAVTFPPFAGRQLYMGGFDLSAPKMPEGYEDYEEIVIELCSAAGAHEGKAYLTVDEKIIPAGMSQRRPGPHVDGAFLEHMNRWGGGPGGSWNHSCNAVPFARMPVIVASDVALCKAWEGVFDAQPVVGHETIPDGDLSHVSLGEGEMLPANVGYILSPDCIHESMSVSADTQRSFIRIALPTDFVV